MLIVDDFKQREYLLIYFYNGPSADGDGWWLANFTSAVSAKGYAHHRSIAGIVWVGLYFNNEPCCFVSDVQRRWYAMRGGYDCFTVYKISATTTTLLNSNSAKVFHVNVRFVTEYNICNRRPTVRHRIDSSYNPGHILCSVRNSTFLIKQKLYLNRLFRRILQEMIYDFIQFQLSYWRNLLQRNTIL